MGRRILPKIDRSIDFSQHFYELNELEEGQSPQSLLNQEQPTELEIGSGKGLFLLNQSARFPERNFIGIEIAKKYARYAAYRLAKFNRQNAAMIRGDALVYLRDFVMPNSLHAVHVYFPDPWWKAKHRKRRVVSSELAIQAERVLIPGGSLHFWTDVEEYYDSGRESILSASSLRGPFAEVPDQGEGDLPYKTHFERRMLVNDHDVFRCRFVKASDGAESMPAHLSQPEMQAIAPDHSSGGNRPRLPEEI